MVIIRIDLFNLENFQDNYDFRTLYNALRFDPSKIPALVCMPMVNFEQVIMYVISLLILTVDKE